MENERTNSKAKMPEISFSLQKLTSSSIMYLFKIILLTFCEDWCITWLC